MTEQRKSPTERIQKNRGPKTKAYRPQFRVPLPDVFVDGKRITGGPTIFDRRYSKSR